MKVGLLFLALGVMLFPLVGGADTSSDLSITTTTMPNPATMGRNLTYDITIINNGPNPVTGVTVRTSLLSLGGAPCPLFGGTVSVFFAGGLFV